MQVIFSDYPYANQSRIIHVRALRHINLKWLLLFANRAEYGARSRTAQIYFALTPHNTRDMFTYTILVEARLGFKLQAVQATRLVASATCFVGCQGAKASEMCTSNACT